MAKLVIILDTIADRGLTILPTVYWRPVTPGLEVPLSPLAPNPSAWRSASDEEIADLRAGRVIEEVVTFTFGQSLDLATIHKLIQIAYQDRVEFLASLPPKGQYYGTYFDGAQWVTTKG